MTIATTFTILWVPYQLNNLVLAYGNVFHALSINDLVKTLTYVNKTPCKWYIPAVASVVGALLLSICVA